MQTVTDFAVQFEAIGEALAQAQGRRATSIAEAVCLLLHLRHVSAAVG
jgi:hypothetical protein